MIQLLAERESMLQKAVEDFHRVCQRRKLNVGKSKVVVFERPRDVIISFAKQY